MKSQWIGTLALLAFLIASLSESASASSPTPGQEAFGGTWAGVLEIGPQQLRLKLEIGFDDSTPTGTLVSIDQGGARIPLDEFSINGREVAFRASSAALSYTGTLKDEKIEGIFRQGGLEVDLTFERNGVAEPETTKKVTDPRDRDIEVRSGDVTLAGSLRIPNGAGPFAGLVILSGSGPQDRDGTIAGQSLYRALADLLESQGIASLRLDDRGVGDSDAVAPVAPSDLADDAIAALKALKAQEAIDCAGFLGHSEGGLIALLAAEEAEPHFVVSLAGMHAPLESILTEQAKAILAASDASEDEMARTRTIQQTVFSAVRNANGPGAVDEVEAALIEAGIEPRIASDQASIWGQPYSVALFKVDPASAARSYEGRLLAFFGARDLQVPHDPFAERLAQQRGDRPTEIRVVKGVDHLFQESDTGLPRDYGTAGHSLAPASKDAITAGIRGLTREVCRR